MLGTSTRGSAPNWDRLYEVASAQAGYVTNEQAHEAGYSLPLLQFHIGKGRLERTRRGILRLLEPLYRSVPNAARADKQLYELLALVDAIRSGRARERELAVKELRSRLE
jgi:hypothetical protein